MYHFFNFCKLLQEPSKKTVYKFICAPLYDRKSAWLLSLLSARGAIVFGNEHHGLILLLFGKTVGSVHFLNKSPFCSQKY